MPFGSLIKQYLYPLLGILVVLVLGYTHYKAQEFGYSRAETKYVKQISEINSKSTELLNQQIEEHNKFVNNQAKALKNLQEENDRLSKIQEENNREATKDPTAKRPAVSKSGVMRLNRIR
ncbi:hypothetical protein EVB79_092 [Rhizobium phage RHph_N3_13]|nr:hypothetical protein EVB79_092 [Rhizobium phage RHph_N3_13]QIG69917.1 hypothetical protein F67_I3_11_091 [Rhizobium phage RHph_I3_11]